MSKYTQIPLPLLGATVEIPMTKGYVAIVDAQDADFTFNHWTTQVSKNNTYAYRHEGKRATRVKVFLHREILSRMLGRPLQKIELVDHVDGDGMNNTRENLRLSDHSHNIANSRISKNNTSGYKGVYLSNNSNRWCASIMINRKTICLGTFDSPIEAHEAYKRKATEIFGEFARFK